MFVNDQNGVCVSVCVYLVLRMGQIRGFLELILQQPVSD